jgi:Predicted transcriptional regulator
MTPVGTTAPQGTIGPETGSKPENNPENEILDKFDENSVVIVPVNDETKKLRQILSNETSMKILEILKKENLSASEVAEKLGLPLTTVKYNIDQLVEYELAYVQRIKYSEKGRQVKIYEAQEKVIIFAPEKVSRVSLISMLQKYAFAFTAAAFGGFG